MVFNGINVSFKGPLTGPRFQGKASCPGCKQPFKGNLEKDTVTLTKTAEIPLIETDNKQVIK